MLVDRTGTFRGRIVSHCVNKTDPGEWPQWVAQLLALEFYDEEERVWVDWSEYDVNEITAYLVLFGSKGEVVLNNQQIKKVTGWDGLSWYNSPDGLENLDLSEAGIQFRVVDDEFNGKIKKKVTWVNEYDAEPGHTTIRKLKPDEAKALEAQYAKYLKATGKKAAPVKAKAGTKPQSPGKVTAKGVEPTQKRGPVTKRGGKDPLGPPTSQPTEQAKTPAPPVPPADDLPDGVSSKEEAWETIYEMKAKEVTDEQIANAWQNTLKEVAPGVEQKKITPHQWYLIREKMLDKTAAF